MGPGRASAPFPTPGPGEYCCTSLPSRHGIGDPGPALGPRVDRLRCWPKLVGCSAAVRPLAALRMSPMKVLFVMWNTLVIGAVASLMLAMTASVQAEGSWCVNKGGTGSVNCGFYSFQQCMASVSGGASFCTQNGFCRVSK
jgi:hypothetical protein